MTIMDTILVMHKGELREQGTHQELLSRRGIYFRLYLLQYRDQLAAEGRGESVAVPTAEGEPAFPAADPALIGGEPPAGG